MSVLEKLVIQNYRNIEFQELHFSPNVNCISGGNGEGKTNLLDAIWYLSMTKSAIAPNDSYNYRSGGKQFALSGSYRMPNETQARFSVAVKEGEKQLRRDDKPYSRISEHIGTLPIVMVSPADTALISDSGEQRRRFANSVISQIDRKYLNDVQTYNKYLQHRNKLLKSDSLDPALLESIDERMDQYARAIYEARKSFVDAISPIIQEYYARISGQKEAVSVRYTSELEHNSLSDILAQTRERDSRYGYTGSGVQKDDLVFSINDLALRHCGSQGQQKSFLVAVKFAQYELMKERCGQAPILLLDDLFDKLDMDRVANLLAMVAGNDFGQIFITDSNKVRISNIVDKLTRERSYFETIGGVYTEIDG